MSVLRHLLQTPAAICCRGIVMVVSAGIATLARNEIARALAEGDPRRWERYGRPSGLFSAPLGSLLEPLSRFMRDSIDEALVCTPPWLAHSPRGVRALRVARVPFVVMFIATALLMYGALRPS